MSFENKIKSLSDSDFRDLFKTFLLESKINQKQLAKEIFKVYKGGYPNIISKFFKKDPKYFSSSKSELPEIFSYFENNESFKLYYNQWEKNKILKNFDNLIKKVDIFNYHLLDQHEKEYLYQDFLKNTTEKRLHKPKVSFICSTQKQEELNKVNFFDIEILKNLLNSFNIDVSSVKFPISQLDFIKIDENYHNYTDVIYNTIKNNLIENNQIKAINEFCNYLMNSDSKHNVHFDNNFKSSYDLLISTGSGKYIEERAGKIAEIFNRLHNSNPELKLLLVGYKSYDPKNNYIFTQAQAVKYFLDTRKAYGVDSEKIILENRPKNFRETISLLIKPIQDLYLEVNKKYNSNGSKKLNLMFITSPMCVLRLTFLIKYYFRDLEHIIDINNIKFCITPEYDKSMIFKINNPESKKCLGLYMEEYFKILSSRVIAEF